MIDCASFQARVREFVLASTPSLAGGAALLAVSGGGDSIAMAALLCESGVIDASRSVVAHFDHRLRGAAAEGRDRVAVEALCARYRLEGVLGRWDAPVATEAAAREARYRFLAAAAEARGLPAIVTGHTSGDQVETVLMHALRGAGLRGLRGMLAESSVPVRIADGRPSVTLTRPLLCVPRAETRAYCAARGLAFADDPTNDDRRYLRNRLRLGLAPRMQTIAPGVLRISAEASDAVEALDALAESALLPAVDAPGIVRLSRQALASLPAAVAPYAYRLALVQLLGDAREFDRRHYRVMSGAASARTGSMFDLPRGVRLTVDAAEIVLSAGRIPAAAIDAGTERPLPFEGVLGAWRLRVVPSDAGETGSLLLPPAEGHKGLGRMGAVVRGRRPGDRIQPKGMRGHKKLQDYYVDRKVPRRERDAAPLIAVGSDVLWTPFGASAQAAAGERYGVSASRVST